MVLLEAAMLAFVGLAVGTAKGIFDTYFMARTAAAVLGGYSVPFHIPGALILASIPIVLIVALASAWQPARLAARTNVAAAVSSE